MDEASHRGIKPSSHREEGPAARRAADVRIRSAYARQRSAYGFDRLTSRIAREAHAERTRAMRRGFAQGAGLAVLAIAVLLAFGVIGPRPEPPVRLWRAAIEPSSHRAIEGKAANSETPFEAGPRPATPAGAIFHRYPTTEGAHPLAAASSPRPLLTSSTAGDRAPGMHGARSPAERKGEIPLRRAEAKEIRGGAAGREGGDRRRSEAAGLRSPHPALSQGERERYSK